MVLGFRVQGFRVLGFRVQGFRVCRPTNYTEDLHVLSLCAPWPHPDPVIPTMMLLLKLTSIHVYEDDPNA